MKHKIKYHLLSLILSFFIIVFIMNTSEYYCSAYQSNPSYTVTKISGSPYAASQQGQSSVNTGKKTTNATAGLVSATLPSNKTTSQPQSGSPAVKSSQNTAAQIAQETASRVNAGVQITADNYAASNSVNSSAGGDASLFDGERTVNSSSNTGSNSDGVGGILEDIINWINDKIADGQEGVIIAIIDMIQKNFEPTSRYFFDQMLHITDGFDNPVFGIITNIAYAFLLIIFTYNLFVIATKVPDPSQKRQALIPLIIRALISIPLIYFSRSVLNEIATLAQHAVNNINPISSASTGTSQILNNWSDLSSFAIIPLIIKFILWCTLTIEVFKLVLEVIERFIVAIILELFSPIAFAFISNQTTSGITKKYLQMYISQEFLLITNKIMLYIFAAILTHGNRNVIGIMTLIAFVITAQRLDNHMKQLGLSVAQTGGALLGSVVGAMAAMRGLDKGARSAAGIAGAALSNSADFGKFAAGQKLSSMAKNGLIAGTITKQDQGDVLRNALGKHSINDIVNATSSSKGNAQLVNAAKQALANGDFLSVAKLNDNLQTAAISSILNSNGELANALGFKPGQAASISNATINGKGIISGTMKAANGDTVAFRSTANRDMMKNPIGEISGSNGVSYGVEITGGIPANSAIALNSMGFDSDALSSLGAYSYETAGGFTSVFNDDGDCVAMMNDEGLAMYAASVMSDDSAPPLNAQNTPLTSQERLDYYAENPERGDYGGLINTEMFESGGELAYLVPGGIQDLYYNESNGTYTAEYHGDREFETKQVHLAKFGSASFDPNRKNARVITLGKGRGSFQMWTETRK